MSEEETIDILYDVFTWVAVPFWALIILFPAWKVTNIMIRTKIIHVAYSIVYAVYMIISQNKSVGTPKCEGCNGSSTDNLISSLTNKYTLTGAWVHYLVFDFFVGCWIVTDSRKKGIPHILVVPCLLLTLFLGPVGFLVYWILRIFFIRQVEEEVEHSDVKYTKNRWIFTIFCKYEATRFLMIWLGTKSFWKDFINIKKWWNQIMISWHLKKKQLKDESDSSEEHDDDDTNDSDEGKVEVFDIKKFFPNSLDEKKEKIVHVSENDVLEVKRVESNEEGKYMEGDQPNYQEEKEEENQEKDEVVEEKQEKDEDVEEIHDEVVVEMEDENEMEEEDVVVEKDGEDEKVETLEHETLVV